MINRNSIFKNQSGISIILFALLLVPLMLVIGMSIDGSNLFLAWTKMQNFSDAANLTALNIRADRGPQMLKYSAIENPNPTFNINDYDCQFVDIGATKQIDYPCLRKQILPIAARMLQQNLSRIGIDVTMPTGAYDGVAPYYFEKLDGAGKGVTVSIDYIDCRTDTATNCINPETGAAVAVSDRDEFEYFTTTITYDVPLYIINAIPVNTGMSNTLKIKVSSQSILPALNLGVLVDVSGSMNESATGAVGGPTKLSYLQTALSFFMQNFRPDRDKVSFWPFNLQVSKNSIAVTPNINEGFDLTLINQKIVALSAKGNTNPVDAMMAAYEDFRTRGGGGSGKAGTIGNLANGTKGEYSLVLFSDGAPTAMTARFADYQPSQYNAMYETSFQEVLPFNLLPGISNQPEFARAALRNKLTEMDVPKDNSIYADEDPKPKKAEAATPPGTYRYGMPSPFYNTSIVKGETYFGRLFDKNDYSTVGDTSGSTVGMNPGSQIEDTGNLIAAYPANINGNTNYLGFGFPKLASTGNFPKDAGTGKEYIAATERDFRDEISLDTNGKEQPTGFKKQFYNNLVAVSDFIRDQKGYVYSVGLGPDPSVSGAVDPYQNVLDNVSRKDNLLARVAGDSTQVKGQFAFINPYLNDNKACKYKAIPTPASCSNWTQLSRKASYLPTTDASKLVGIFQKIARQIQSKIVSDPKARTVGAMN